MNIDKLERLSKEARMMDGREFIYLLDTYSVEDLIDASNVELKDPLIYHRDKDACNVFIDILGEYIDDRIEECS